jgi:putative redox protein
MMILASMGPDERSPQEATMPQELCVHAVHQGGMHFVASTADHSVNFDYPLQSEETKGFTPLQMLLASLASCAGSTVGLLLGQMRQPLAGLEVEARGKRRDEHPTVITEIALDFVLRGDGLDPDMVAKALQVAEEKICPVWAMLKTGTPITSSFRIVED